jgi:hypothetical protein
MCLLAGDFLMKTKAAGFDRLANAIAVHQLIGF